MSIKEVIKKLKLDPKKTYNSKVVFSDIENSLHLTLNFKKGILKFLTIKNNYLG